MTSKFAEPTFEEIKAPTKSAFSMGPFGSRIKAENFVTEGVPVIKGGNLNGDLDSSSFDFLTPEKAAELSTSIARRLDLVITHRGTLGQVGIIPPNSRYPEYIVSQSQLKLTFDHTKANPYFIYYFLRSPEGQRRLLANTSQVGVPAIAQALTSIRNIRVPLPTLKEQDGVVGTLRLMDDRITLLRETNATLEAIAQALFKSWFVDFDPVYAKAQGSVPEGMDEATAALFPDGFEESELGLVPRGWRLVQFGKLLSHTIGGDWGDETPNEKNDTRVAIIRGTDIPDLQNGGISRVPLRYTSLKKLSGRKLQNGDIVLEVSGGSKDQPTGRSLYLTDGMLKQFDCPVEPASFCRLLRPETEYLGILLGQHLSYIYAQGKTWEYQNQSTGIANFQTTHFLETELVTVPPQEVLAAFSSIVRPMIDRSHLTQMQMLGTLRDTLLPRLISGQLRLPEAEVGLEEVMA